MVATSHIEFEAKAGGVMFEFRPPGSPATVGMLLDPETARQIASALAECADEAAHTRAGA